MKKFNWGTIFVVMSLSFVFIFSGCTNNPPVTPQIGENQPEIETPVVDEQETEPEVVKPEPEPEPEPEVIEVAAPTPNTLLYIGQGSLRITTPEGKVIYIDPWDGSGFYEVDMASFAVPADLILQTHDHNDHNQLGTIKNKNSGCKTITQVEALLVEWDFSDPENISGARDYQTFEFDFVTVEAVEAYNEEHGKYVCVGYILTLTNGISIYISGDTSTTEQMKTFADRNIDYAFFCCDGVWNMDIDEAKACADLVGAKHSIPYHMNPNVYEQGGASAPFVRERAEMFDVESQLIIEAGEEITLE